MADGTILQGNSSVNPSYGEAGAVHLLLRGDRKQMTVTLAV